MSNDAKNTSGEEQVLNIAETATRLGVAGRTVNRWIEQGLFPNAYRMSPVPKSPYRIPISDIIAFEEKRQL